MATAHRVNPESSNINESKDGFLLLDRKNFSYLVG